MRRNAEKIYAVGLLIAFIIGQILVVGLAWLSLDALIECVVGFAVGCFLTPTLHELGHICFGSANGMALKYTKFFCFRFMEENGKMKFSFCSPFESEQTQMAVKYGGDIKKRAAWYTVGGVIFGGVYVLLMLGCGLLLSLLGVNDGSFSFWGALPYAAYLFLLNVAPFEYVSGKTDILILQGILRDHDVEKNMLAAMEIPGQVYQGKTFGEVEKTLYFDLPQLCEDEPLYAIVLDLRYRYYLDIGDYEKAAQMLDRLACSAEYLTDEQAQQLAAQFVYMHSLYRNQAEADKSGKLCQQFLVSDSVEAKRILAAYSAAFGQWEKAVLLIEQANALLRLVKCKGEARFEEKLLAQITENE